MSAVDHPLERAVHRGAADPRFFPAHDIEQIVRAEVAFLTQEDAEDAIALAGALAAGRTKAGVVGEGAIHQ